MELDSASHEQSLVEALRCGDESAFVTLVDRYHMPMLRVAARFVSSDTVAEGVVQDTWLGVLQGIDRFRAQASLKTWLFTILLNQARRRGAKEHHTIPFSAFTREDTKPAVEPDHFFSPGHKYAGHWIGEIADWGQLAEEIVLAKETRAVVQRTIETLPLSQSIVITLRDLEGWSAAEVCHVLAITESNQRVRLHRARCRVRRELERYFEGTYRI